MREVAKFNLVRWMWRRGFCCVLFLTMLQVWPTCVRGVQWQGATQDVLVEPEQDEKLPIFSSKNDLKADSGTQSPTQYLLKDQVSDQPSWAEGIRVGYDKGFVIAAQQTTDLGIGDSPFQLKINGWGQLRQTIFDSKGPNNDLNQFQLQRARVIASGSVFTPDFSYFIQIDGRSSSGDNVRLLDYYLTYDLGHHRLGWDEGRIGLKTGQYKIPFTMSRWLSGREFQFADRSVASTYFDVNRSLAWGIYGKTPGSIIPINWEVALFNGLVTGGAETGSSGSLDNNFAYSGRIYFYPNGEWGEGQLADFDCHDQIATRVGAAVASTTINRIGSTEFNSLRVVDSGNVLATLLPLGVEEYSVNMYAVDASCKYRGWSATTEYYFRCVNGFQGAAVPDLFDHGYWLQLGKFVVPQKLELLTRWSRVVGNSGTLGANNQSADEVAGGFVWYMRGQHAKFTFDATWLDGAPVSSSALNITPGYQGLLVRSQIQFAF